MREQSFLQWLNTFRMSINGYQYYTDFEKIYQKANEVKIEISILNSLIGSRNIEDDFAAILKKYPECLKVVPLLLAVREKEIYCQDGEGAITYRFDQMKQTIAQYQYFMRKTGLFDMIQNHIINNLFDYITGIEVGLDSNGRKNRGGDQMEDLVEEYLKKAGVKYYKEIYLTEIEKKWGINLSAISAGGTSTKRWDFAVKTEKRLFVIETNFYTGGGSKLNEVARSYKMIANEAQSIKDFSFVWITDGKGWLTAKNNLEETFNTLETLYNIADMENGILERLFN